MSRYDQLLTEIRDLDDIDRSVAACEMLEAEATEDWLPALRKLLVEGEDFYVREAAAGPVARLEGVASLPLLLRALKLGFDENHDNDGLQARIFETVEGDPGNALPFLRTLADSDSDLDRHNAAWLLGFIRGNAKILLRLSRDKAPEVRSAAIGSLASEKGNEEIFARLIDALQDSAPEVANAAVSSLGYFGDQRAIEPLQTIRKKPGQLDQAVFDYALELLKESLETPAAGEE